MAAFTPLVRSLSYLLFFAIIALVFKSTLEPMQSPQIMHYQFKCLREPL